MSSRNYENFTQYTAEKNLPLLSHYTPKRKGITERQLSYNDSLDLYMKNTTTIPQSHPHHRFYQRPKKGRQFFGDSGWTILHSMCAAYNPNKNYGRHRMRVFLPQFGYLTPCEICSNHFIEGLKELQYEKYLGSNHDLFLLSYLLHDRANNFYNQQNPDKPKKTSPPYILAKGYYFNAMGENCDECISVK